MQVHLHQHRQEHSIYYNDAFITIFQIITNSHDTI